MPELETVFSMVIALVIMGTMLVVMQSATHSLMEAMPVSSSWNATVGPAPVPTAVPTSAPTVAPVSDSQAQPSGIDWVGNALIITPFAAAGAAIFTYMTRRRPNTRQTEQGIDSALDDSVRSNRQELEMTTLGDLTPQHQQPVKESSPEPVVEKPGKSRWEQLE